MPVAQRAAHDTPVTVDVTHTVLGQQVAVEHCWPAPWHEPAQYFVGAQTADVPSIRTVQQPVLHWVPFRQFAAQSEPLLGSFASKTHVCPPQQGVLSEHGVPAHVSGPESAPPDELEAEEDDDEDVDGHWHASKPPPLQGWLLAVPFGH